MTVLPNMALAIWPLYTNQYSNLMEKCAFCEVRDASKDLTQKNTPLCQKCYDRYNDRVNRKVCVQCDKPSMEDDIGVEDWVEHDACVGKHDPANWV